tara:strand:+ start:258 stop:533 length:276 start_codon:yes stop_codon:yes gene_type:complete
MTDKGILKYEPHGCEYTMEDNILLTRPDYRSQWLEPDYEHCIAEGINHYEVFKHFGKEKWYVDLLFDFAHDVEICEGLIRKTNKEVKNGTK